MRFLLDGLSEDLGRIRAKSSLKTSSRADLNKNCNIQNDTDFKNSEASTNLLSLAFGDDGPTSPTTSSPSKSRPQPPSVNNPKSSLPEKFRSKIRSVSTTNTDSNTHSHQRNISEVSGGEENSTIDDNAYDISAFKKLQLEAKGREKERHGLDDQNLKQVIKESKAAWESHMKKNDSVITDIFGGQLQSTIECLTCHNRSHCFDPFLDIAVPIEIPQNNGSDTRGRFARRNIREPSSCTLEDCFASFTATEILEGDNAYNCEKCKSKQRSSKRLTIFKYPRVLVSWETKKYLRQMCKMLLPPDNTYKEISVYSNKA